MLTRICYLKKVWEVEFLTFLREANNKYLKPYDTKQESKRIIYLNANNLYGYAMSKFLPLSGFKLANPEDFDLNK